MRLRQLLIVAVTITALLQPTVAAADNIRDREFWLTDYGFQTAWKTTTGKGIKVAIIDTGIDAAHQDLVGAVIDGTDVSGLGNKTGTKPVGESSYHGTLVASLLAGRGHGAESGVIGVAPGAQLLSVSMAFGKNAPSTDEQLVKAMRWSVDHGAKVINLSLTRNSTDWPQSWDAAFQYAFDRDVIVVAAAGNRASGVEKVSAPASIPGVVVVAGVDRNRAPSNLASTAGVNITVSAPSTDLVGAISGNDYKIFSGTSGAAPIVSGAFALVRSAHPDWSANQCIQAVISSATKMTKKDFSPIYGYGLINPQAAIEQAPPVATANPLGSLSEWVKLYRKSTQASEGEISAPIESVDEANNEPANASPDTTTWFPIAVYSGFAVLLIVGLVRRKARGKGHKR